MRSKSSFCLSLLILLSFLVIPTRLCAAEVIQRIIAVVNDEIITEEDLQTVMAPVVSQYRTIYTGHELDSKIKRARQDFLNKVIEDKLVLSEAKKRQVIMTDTEVDEMMAEVRNKFPTKELFAKALADQGITEKKLWNRFHDQIMSQKLVSFEVKSKVSVSPGEVSEYYKNHTEEFTQGERLKLLQILIREGNRTDEEAKKFADSLIEQIDAGKPFEELAKSYSEGAEAKEGGLMGWVERGQLLGEIEGKIFLLSEGQHTAPIKSTLGYHIFKVLERQSAQAKPLTEVREDIQDKIFKEKLKWRLDAWIASLKKNAYISVR